MNKNLVGVIGGSGFIGSRLVQTLLEQNLRVRIIDRQPSQGYPELWTKADVRDQDALLEACRGCDVLYNLAAEHHDNVDPPELYRSVNVDGALTTCAVAEALGICHLIFTSTVAVYGFPVGEIDEAAPTNPFNEYGRTKLEAEGVFLSWAKRFANRSLTIVRPTVVFGPGNRGNVYVLLAQIARGRSVVIGDGRNKKSLAYVANVAEFLAHTLSFAEGIHIYNYVDKPDQDMNGLVAIATETLGRGRSIHIPFTLAVAVGKICDLISQLAGRQLLISSVRVKKYASSTQFAVDRMAKSGFRPRHSLHEALVNTIRHEFVDAPPRGEPSPASVRP